MSSVLPRTASESEILGFFANNLVWPTCPVSQASFQPLFNDRGQDPCTIALSLLKTCDPHLEEGTSAYDVWAFQNSPCACNTVLYSLFNVCGQCAGKSDFEETTWEVFQGALRCTSPIYQEYMVQIPLGTAIPAWAYLPLGADGKVDLAQAQEAAAQHKPDMTSPGSYNSSSPAAEPTSTFTPVPTSDLTRPRSGTSPIATPATSFEISSAAVPEPALPVSDSTTLSVALTAKAGPSAPPAGAPGPTSLTRKTTTLSPTLGSALHGPASDFPASSMTSAIPPSASTQSTSQETIAKSNRNLAPIFGGVLGGVAAAVLAAFLASCLVRRRRRRHHRREKEAAFASGSLDWWRRPEHLHNADREFTEGSVTVKAETDLEVDDVETLHAMSVPEKKSVTYGEYPDL